MSKKNNKLRAARERAGLSQAQVAEQLKVSQASVSDWERGVSVPDWTSWVDLMRLLDEPDLGYREVEEVVRRVVPA